MGDFHGCIHEIDCLYKYLQSLCVDTFPLISWRHTQELFKQIGVVDSKYSLLNFKQDYVSVKTVEQEDLKAVAKGRRLPRRMKTSTVMVRKMSNI